jgi:hypothetical protein
MEQQRCLRFPVRFRSSFTSANVVGGEGSIIDLSIRGCRVDSPVMVMTGTTLELRIHAAEHEPPIAVDQAIVRWSRNHQFGVEFMSLQPDEWARLQHIVKELRQEPYAKKAEQDASPS